MQKETLINKTIQNIKCKQCDYTFTSTRILIKHKKIFIYQIYKCNQCDENFTTMRNLMKHLRTVKFDIFYLLLICIINYITYLC